MLLSTSFIGPAGAAVEPLAPTDVANSLGWWHSDDGQAHTVDLFKSDPAISSNDAARQAGVYTIVPNGLGTGKPYFHAADSSARFSPGSALTTVRFLLVVYRRNLITGTQPPTGGLARESGRGIVRGSSNNFSGPADESNRFYTKTHLFDFPYEVTHGAGTPFTSNTAAAIRNGVIKINGFQYPWNWTPQSADWEVLTIETTGDVELAHFLLTNVGPGSTADCDFADIEPFSAVPSEATQAGLILGARERWNLTTRPPLIYMSTDSMGQGSEDNNNVFAMPLQLFNGLQGIGKRCDMLIDAVGSRPMSAALTNFVNNAPEADPDRSANWLFIEGGGNDHGLNGDTAAEVFDTCMALCEAGEAKGYDRMVMPPVPFRGSGNDAEWDQWREDLMDLYEGEVSGGTRITRLLTEFWNDLNVGQHDSPTASPTYFRDLVHWSPALGQGYVAETIVKPVFDEVLP